MSIFKTKTTKETIVPESSVTENPDNVHRINLGDRVKDTVTGAEGIVVSYSKHLTGCDTITLELGLNDQGNVPVLAIDVTRAEVILAGEQSKDKLPGYRKEDFEDTFSGKPVPAAG